MSSLANLLTKVCYGFTLLLSLTMTPTCLHLLMKRKFLIPSKLLFHPYYIHRFTQSEQSGSVTRHNRLLNSCRGEEKMSY